ncbi:MAG: zinc dependent phospholipase C family protein [Elusimicrobia bacterium]|nr:zinc dependent phospholipase C family protein [Elusimicrobiota bacterium]
MRKTVQSSEFGVRRIIMLLLLLFTMNYELLTTNCLYGWIHNTHREIASQAARNRYLPTKFRDFLIQNESKLREGSIYPDIYDDSENRAHNSEICLDLVLKIKEELLKPERKTDKKFFLDLGRISHYIADANQPLHCDQRQFEETFHQRYEDNAADLALKYVPRKPNYISDIPTMMASDAKYGWEHYSDIADAYIGNPGNQVRQVEKLTKNQIINAYNETVDIWYTIWREKIFLMLKMRQKIPVDYLTLSEEYMKDNLIDRAVDNLNYGIKVFPNEVKLYSRLADIFQKVNEPKKTAGILKKCVKTNPQAIDIRRRLAFIYEKLDKKDDAVKEWEALKGSKYDAEAKKHIKEAERGK